MSSSHLNHRHVALDVTLAIEFRGFAQEDRDVVRQAFLHTLAHVGAHKEGVMLEDAFKFRVDVRSGAFRVGCP